MENQLMNATVAASLPALYSQEVKGDASLAVVKYFCLSSDWRWYATEYDPEDKLFFGLVHGFEVELGYFSLGEFEALNATSGMPVIERNLHWKPMSIGVIKQDIAEYGYCRQ
jgi:hypothetical protein